MQARSPVQTQQVRDTASQSCHNETKAAITTFGRTLGAIMSRQLMACIKEALLTHIQAPSVHTIYLARHLADQFSHLMAMGPFSVLGMRMWTLLTVGAEDWDEEDLDLAAHTDSAACIEFLQKFEQSILLNVAVTGRTDEGLNAGIITPSTRPEEVVEQMLQGGDRGLALANRLSSLHIS